jgi:hypothetical protein
LLGKTVFLSLCVEAILGWPVPLLLSVLYEVISERSTVAESILSIEEVHDLLDQLSKSSQL